MSGTRKFNDPTETTAKITILIAPALDRQLRELAVRRGQPVGGVVREWIVQGLREAEPSGLVRSRTHLTG
jgi:hypothetical protein